jgi:hypothetical protein
MNVTAHTATFRDRTRGVTRPLTARATDELALEVEWDVTTTAQVGERVFGSVSIASGSGRSVAQPSLGDPDYCVAANLGNGVALDLELVAGGARLDERSICLPTTWPLWEDQPDRTIDFEIVPANTGTLTLELIIVGSRSDNRLAIETQPITVRERDDDGSGDSDGDGDSTTGGVVDCPDGFYWDEAAQACLENAGTNNTNGDTTDPNRPCSGVVDALTRSECSVDAYVQNAGQGAFIGLGIFAIAFLALATN